MKHHNILTILLLVALLLSCSKAILDRQQFTALLIDIHQTDAMLAELNLRADGPRADYKYYNDLFAKYGITRADFDSCLAYYTRQPEIFTAIYDAVIDTLSRRQTDKMRVWNQLTRLDTLNLFPGYTLTVADTIPRDSLAKGRPRRDSVIRHPRLLRADTVALDPLNPYILVRVDSLLPGLYEFSTHFKWDKTPAVPRHHLLSYFLDPHGDTLRVRDIYVTPDTVARQYKWTHYLPDSAYSRLEIQLVVEAPDRKPARRATAPRQARVWGTVLNKKYTTDKQAEKLKQQYRPRENKKNSR